MRIILRPWLIGTIYINRKAEFIILPHCTLQGRAGKSGRVRWLLQALKVCRGERRIRRVGKDVTDLDVLIDAIEPIRRAKEVRLISTAIRKADLRMWLMARQAYGHATQIDLPRLWLIDAGGILRLNRDGREL